MASDAIIPLAKTASSKLADGDRSNETLNQASAALFGIFLSLPLGSIGKAMALGIRLAEQLRQARGVPMPDANGLYHLNKLTNDEAVRADDSRYIRLLEEFGQKALNVGDLEIFANVLDPLGLALIDTRNTDAAYITLSKAVMIDEALGLDNLLPSAALPLAYATKYWAMEGKIIWDDVLNSFEKAEKALDAAQLPTEQMRKLRVACFIDRVPAIVEVARDEHERGRASPSDLDRAFESAKKLLDQGRALAQEKPVLTRYLNMADQFEAQIETIKLKSD